MARLFNGSNQYLRGVAPTTAAYPFSLHAIFKPSQAQSGIDSEWVVLSLNNPLNLNRVYISCHRPSTDPQQILAFASDGTNTRYRRRITTLNAGTAYSLVAVFTSSSDIEIYVDGLAGTSTITSGNGLPNLSATAQVVGILPYNNGLFHGATPGEIAEVAVWNVALTSSDVASLAARVSPSLVRPSNLISHAPLRGEYSPEPEFRGGRSLTLYNSPVKASHPRLIARKRRANYFFLATSHNLIGADCSQNAQSATAAAAQQHALAGTGASQPATATSLAIGQIHALQGLESLSVGTSGTGAIGQSVALAGLGATQSGESSVGSISQVAQLVGSNSTQNANADTGVISLTVVLAASPSQQVNQSSTDKISQAHSLNAAPSVQTNFSSIGGISGELTLGASTSTGVSISGIGSITQNHILLDAASVQSAVSDVKAVSQTHLLSSSVNQQFSIAATDAVSQIYVLSGLHAIQNAMAAVGFITIPGSGEFTGYIKNTLFVVDPVDTGFVIKPADTQFVIER